MLTIDRYQDELRRSFLALQTMKETPERSGIYPAMRSALGRVPSHLGIGELAEMPRS